MMRNRREIDSHPERLVNLMSTISTTLIVLFTHGIDAQCTGGDYLGETNVNSNSGKLDTNTNQQYFMMDAQFVSSCCGAVTTWKVFAGATGNIALQVWRPTAGGSSAVLVGENYVNIGSTGEFTYNVPTLSQIPIEASDFIGWYVDTVDIVEYKTAGSQNDNNYIETIASQPSVGDTVSYSNNVQGRTYAIHAGLGPASAPTFSNLPATEHEYASLIATGKSMFTATSSTPSVVTFTLNSISPFADFAVSSTTGEVTALTSAVSETTYTLDIGVSTSCSASTTETLTIVVSPTAPVWSNLDTAMTVSKNDVSPTITTYTVEATNPVVNGSVSYTLQSIIPATGGFGVDSSTGDVIATSSQTSGGTYTMTIRATDQYGNYVDGTLAVTVVNLVPEINSLPDVVDISESAVDETLLHIINVTDADGDAVTCSMTSSPSGPFLTKYLIINDIFSTGIYLQANPSLDYSTTTAYELSVSCTDGETTSSSKVLYAYVTPNDVPVITNLRNTTSILSSTPSSTIIFTVLSTDTEGDQTFYALSCAVASPCPFAIYSDGSVTLTMSLLHSTTKAYELDISVNDEFSSSGTHRLTVFISDLNTPPELNNLPASLQIPEDAIIGTTLFDVSVYDEDGDTSHTFAVSFSPASSSSLLKVNATTGAVTLTTSLNYLTQPNSYSLTIEVSDGQSTSTAQVLTIDVVDVNQVPVLYKTNYKVQIDEGVAGTSAPNPGFNVYDPDGDTLTYSWAGSGGDTSGFAIDSNDGTVSLTIDFDVDDDNVDTLYVWLAVVSDPEGLSCTATLTLTVLDINDNVPALDSSYYAATVSETAGLSTVVLQVTATDADRTEMNRQIEYSVSGTSLFGIDNSGRVFVTQNLDAYVGTVQTFTVRVQNPNNSSSSSANIVVSVEESVNNDDFFDNTANIVWVTLACILGLLVLTALAYLSYLACKKWGIVATKKSRIIQVAPNDTKIPLDRVQPSRESLATRAVTLVTPSDVRVIDSMWEPWQKGWWDIA